MTFHYKRLSQSLKKGIFVGYTSHNITTLPQQEQYIMLDLNAVYMMNHIKFLLWDKDNRSYSYYVECSVDRTTWTRVADYTKFLCRSWQNLHFKSCPVRYIKLVGTHNTANTVFHVVELEAYYSDNQPKLVNEMISPTFNVATKEKGANVIEGICNAGDTLDVLLNGEVTKHTGHSGYVYHNLGKDLGDLGDKIWRSQLKWHFIYDVLRLKFYV